MSDDKVVGISVAAQRVGCSEGTLRRYHKQGVIHPEIRGKRRLFSQNDINTARCFLTNRDGHKK